MSKIRNIHCSDKMKTLFPFLVLVLLCVGCWSTGFRPIDDNLYDEMVRILRGKPLPPVKFRSRLQANAILRLHRQPFQLDVNDHLVLHGKRAARVSDVKKMIARAVRETKAAGARKLKLALNDDVHGISERRVRQFYDTSKVYSRLNARFTNKVNLQPILSDAPLKRLQLDLIDLKALRVKYNGESYRYVLTLIDVFSRYSWLRPLKTKESREIASILQHIFNEHGQPVVLQSDNGKEFKGAVKTLAQKLGIKCINSRPYRPQTQGKVERSHRSLRKKIAFDFLTMSSKGSNWVQNLGNYARTLNLEKREELGNRSPFEVYFGRKSNRGVGLLNYHYHTMSDKYQGESPITHEKLKEFEKTRTQWRSAAAAADRRVAARTVKRNMAKHPPSVYKLNEKVLVRVKVKGKTKSSIRVVESKILDRNLRLARYKIWIPDSGSTQWVSVTEIASLTRKRETKKRMRMQKSLHKTKYYLPLEEPDFVNGFREMGFTVPYNPIGNGDCQFAAVSHELRKLGIERSSDTLRTEIVQDLRVRPQPGFVVGSYSDYLESMAKRGTYGDHLTLSRIAECFRVRILVVDARGPVYSTIIAPHGDENAPMIVLGYLPEEQGEHYVVLQGDVHSFVHEIGNDPSNANSTRSASTSGNSDSGQSQSEENHHSISAGSSGVLLKSNNITMARHDSSDDLPDINSNKNYHPFDSIPHSCPVLAHANDTAAAPDSSDVFSTEPNAPLVHRLTDRGDGDCNEGQLDVPLLPWEIIYQVIDTTVRVDRCALSQWNRVNSVCRSYVSRYYPRIYLSPEIRNKLSLPEDNLAVHSTIHVRRLSGVAGRYSGLASELRSLFATNSLWWNGILTIVPEGSHNTGWYVIVDITLSKKNRRFY